jgi:hypothetical protein
MKSAAFCMTAGVRALIGASADLPARPRIEECDRRTGVSRNFFSKTEINIVSSEKHARGISDMD